ncbi:FEKKY domain-containing protein [Chryseobacterium indologenes]|uniref:FEKKY domain-containing protein n=1 Tax=Chryseobacterium indologenes TaxID=253 RepID=UPI00124AF90A|nr:hypothetical protein [Chryseobacterium indologenes]
MIREILLLVLMLSMISCTTTKELTEENNIPGDGSYFTILYYGYPNTERLILAESISEKWKIKYEEAAGCAIDGKTERKIEDKNRKTYAKIEKKYGEDWKIKYEKDIIDAGIAQADIMDILITNKTFRAEIEKHHIEIDGVDKEVWPLKESGAYQVKIYGSDEKNEEINCCTFHVNTKNKTVYLIK